MIVGKAVSFIFVFILALAPASLLGKEGPSFYLVEIAQGLSKKEATKVAVMAAKKGEMQHVTHLYRSKDVYPMLPNSFGLGVQVVRRDNGHQVLAYIGDSFAKTQVMYNSVVLPNFPKAVIKKGYIDYDNAGVTGDARFVVKVLIMGSFKRLSKALKKAKSLALEMKVPFIDEKSNDLYFRYSDCSKYCLTVVPSSRFPGLTPNLYVITGPVVMIGGHPDRAQKKMKKYLLRSRRFVKDAYFKSSVAYYGCTL